MRYILPVLVVVLAACGGGGGDLAPSLQSAALEGVIYELDGQTLDRSGVSVTVLETGESVLTAADGRFDFASVPAGNLTLQFDAAPPLLADMERTREEEQEQERVEEGEGDQDRIQDRDRDRIHEHECDEDCEHADDDQGTPRLVRVRERERVRIRCALNDGEVTEFSCESEERHRARARLERAEGSPDPDVEGKVRVRSEFQHQVFAVEVENLEAGVAVEFFLDDPSDEAGFASVGTAVADANGEAEMERNSNNGDQMPFGVDSVAELAGFRLQVRLANGGEILMKGEVPDLPSPGPIEGGSPGAQEHGRGKAELAPMGGDGVECKVEIRSRPDRDEERFCMEAEHLEAGTPCAFEIENPDSGEFVRFARRLADGEGEAEVCTQDGLAMPLGAQGVRELVGLQVRVVLDDETGRTLCAGFVPALVAD